MTDAFARSTDPTTSNDAAASVRATDLETTVFEIVKSSVVGMTLDEICDATGLEKVTASPRLRPLEKKGFVIRSGSRIGRSGRRQTVWRAR